jgi:hypothetical protein
MTTATRPPLEVRNYGGVKQLSVTTEHDLARIDQVDPARWAATSAPLRDLHCDAKFLDFLDTHSKGRIRVSELVQARDWAFERLASRAALIARSDVLTLADLDIAKDTGKRIRQTADHVLAELKSATRDKVTLAQVRTYRAGYSKNLANGDGVVCPELLPEPDVAAFLKDILTVIAGVKDASGNPGVGTAELERFLAQGHAWLAWKARPATTPAVVPWGDDTAQAATLTSGLDAKVEEFFWHCELMRQQAVKAEGLRLPEPELRALQAKDAATIERYLTESPLAQPNAGGVLLLDGNLNVVYRDRLSVLRTKVLERALGPGTKELTRESWRAVKVVFEPFHAWRRDMPPEPFDKLGEERVRAMLSGPHLERLRHFIAIDKAAAPEVERLSDLEKLILFQRWLLELTNNFVNFSHVYAPNKTAMIERGSMVIDGRRLDFCVRVEDRAAHKKVAAESLCFLVYAALTERDQDGKPAYEVVAPVTAGERGRLRVGKRGIFIDVEGREWDATVTDIVENPISIIEAIKAPFRRAAAFIAKKAEELASSKLAAAGDQAAGKVAIAPPPGSAPAPAPAPAPAAPPAAPPPAAAVGMQNMLLMGTVAFAAIGSTMTYLVSTLADLSPFKLIGGILSVIGIICALSAFLGWLKLRQRDMSLLFEANGWAVNASMKVTRRLGGLFTRTPNLPRGTVTRWGDELAPLELDDEALARRRKRRLLTTLFAVVGVTVVFCACYLRFPTFKAYTRHGYFWAREKITGDPAPPLVIPADVAPEASTTTTTRSTTEVETKR